MSTSGTAQVLRIFDPARAATVTVEEDKQTLLSWLIANSKEPQHVVRMMDDDKTVRDGKKNAPPDESYIKEALRVANKIAGCIHPETWLRVSDATVQSARSDGRPYDMLQIVIKNNEAFRPDDNVLKRRFANEWEAFSLKTARRTGPKACDDFVAAAMHVRNVRALSTKELFESASRKLHDAFPMKGAEIKEFTTFNETAAALRRWMDEYALEAQQTAPADGMALTTQQADKAEPRGRNRKNRDGKNRDGASTIPCKLCSDINTAYKRGNVNIELPTDHWHRNCPSIAAAVNSDAIRRQMADALGKARIRPRPSQAMHVMDNATPSANADEDTFSYTAYDTLVSLATSNNNEHPVLLDSGANVNIFTKHQLPHLKFDSPIVGQATIGTFNGSTTVLRESATHDVFGPGRYFADGKVDIVSISMLEDSGWNVHKEPGSFTASNPAHHARFDVTARGLYALSKIVKIKASPLVLNASAPQPDTKQQAAIQFYTDFHAAIGHPSAERTKHTLSATGLLYPLPRDVTLDAVLRVDPPQCSICLESKMAWSKRVLTQDQLDASIPEPGASWSIDILHPSTVDPHPNLFMVDVRTGVMLAPVLKNKTTLALLEAINKQKNLLLQVGRVLRHVSSDAEPTLVALEPFLAQQNITYSPRKAGQHEKPAERAIRTMFNVVRSEVIRLRRAGVKVPATTVPYLIAHAAQLASFAVNVHTQSARISPLAALMQRAVAAPIAGLQFLDFVVTKTVPKQSDSSVFTPKAEPAVVLLVDPKDRNSALVLTLGFNESGKGAIMHRHLLQKVTTPAPEWLAAVNGMKEGIIKWPEDFGDTALDVAPSDTVPTVPPAATPPATPAPTKKTEAKKVSSKTTQRPVRAARTRHAFDWANNAAVPSATLQPGPSSVREVQAVDPDGLRAARTLELKDMLTQEAFEPVNAQSVPFEATRRAFHSKDVVTIKDDGRIKYRLVVLGQSQRLPEGLSSSLATLPMSSLKTLLTIACIKKLPIEFLDLKQAYTNAASSLKGSFLWLNGTNVNILCELKPDWLQFRTHDGRLLVAIKKAMYGLKNAGRDFFEHHNEVMTKLKWKQLDCEPTVFRDDTAPGARFAAEYVDDIIHVGHDAPSFFDSLRPHYPLGFKTKKPPTVFLGIHVWQSTDFSWATLDQSDYIDKLMNDFKVTGVASTPCDRFIFEHDSGDTIDPPRYSSMVAALGFLRTTRPEILLALSVLQQHAHAPTQKRWNDLNHLLRYLNGTRKFGVIIAPESSTPVVDISADASFSVYPSPGCESHGGTLITVAGVVVEASSKKIDSPMPTSSTTAELMQFHRSLAKWEAQRSLVEEMGFNIPPSLGLQDNHSTITLLVNAFGKALKNKALARRAAEVKDHLKNGKLRLVYQPTEQMAADGFTKPLPPTSFQVFRSRLGVANIEQIQLAGVNGFLGHGGVLGRPGS
jgi:hypothetical protein